LSAASALVSTSRTRCLRSMPSQSQLRVATAQRRRRIGWTQDHLAWRYECFAALHLSRDEAAPQGECSFVLGGHVYVTSAHRSGTRLQCSSFVGSHSADLYAGTVQTCSLVVTARIPVARTTLLSSRRALVPPGPYAPEVDIFSQSVSRLDTSISLTVEKLDSPNRRGGCPDIIYRPGCTKLAPIDIIPF